jgi:putative addiction module component (TIGR02574 family)
MTKNQIAELHRLSKQEKIELVQMLWEDIAHDIDFNDLPEDHKAILEERLALMKQGKAEFKSWEDVQEKYKRL